MDDKIYSNKSVIIYIYIIMIFNYDPNTLT